jgi:hypothetical protein
VTVWTVGPSIDEPNIQPVAVELQQSLPSKKARLV